MKRLILSIAVLTLGVAEKVEAQSDSVLTRALTDTISLLGRLSADSSMPSRKREVGPVRLASASGGFLFGALLGGFAGHEVREENCAGKCKTRIGESLLTGASLGGVLGAAFGAAFLDLASTCSFDRRLLRTLAGSTVGASALFLVAGGTDERRGSSAFFIPIGAIGGALGSLGRCWKSGL